MGGTPACDADSDNRRAAILCAASRTRMTSAASDALPPTAPADPHPERTPSRNFFARHWRGDYNLARSYWLHTALMQFGVVALSAGVTHALAHNAPARAASSALLVIYVMGLALWIWAVVGTWRSADREQARNRRAGMSNLWPLIAKVMIVLGAVGTSSAR